MVPLLLAVLTMLAASLTGCGGGEGTCRPDAEANQSQGASVVASRCTTCHDSSLSGADRLGAPEGYNFDDPQIVRDTAAEMRDEIASGRMPKDGPLSAEEISAVQAYLDCLGE